MRALKLRLELVEPSAGILDVPAQLSRVVRGRLLGFKIPQTRALGLDVSPAWVAVVRDRAIELGDLIVELLNAIAQLTHLSPKLRIPRRQAGQLCPELTEPVPHVDVSCCGAEADLERGPTLEPCLCSQGVLALLERCKRVLFRNEPAHFRLDRLLSRRNTCPLIVERLLLRFQSGFLTLQRSLLALPRAQLRG